VETIGELLRETRLNKGYSYEDIQEITKIRTRYIKAIEEGDLTQLPGPFYSKAFIRTYAEALELSPDILLEYEHTLPKANINDVTVKSNINYLANPPSKWAKWLTLSLVFVLIFLVLLFAYMFIVNSTDNNEVIPGDHIEDTRLETTEEPNKQPNQENNTPKGNNTANNDSKNMGNIEQGNEEKPTSTITKVSTSTYKHRPIDTYEVTVPIDGTIELQLKFNDLCWFDIRDEGPKGKQLLTNTLDAGKETNPITLNKQVSIHLGNASGVDIYINGNKIKAGTENGPKYISILRK